MVSRRFVRMDVLSGRHFVRTSLHVLSGRHFVRTALDVLSGLFYATFFQADRRRRFFRISQVVRGGYEWLWAVMSGYGWLRVVMGGYELL